MEKLKSKIVWLNVIAILVAVIGPLANVFPEYAIIFGIVVNILTIILRALQGVEVPLGNGKTYQM